MDLKLKCLTLRVEHRLRVFQNRVLMKIFGSERDKVTGELCDMYSLQTVIWVTNSRGIRWSRDMAHVQQRRDVYSVLVKKPDGKRPLKKRTSGLVHSG